MFDLICRVFKMTGIPIALLLALAAVGCGVNPGIDWVGNVGVYNYSPSIIQSGNLRQVWWCGQGVNPADHAQNTDTIQYESMNLITGYGDSPKTVLAETPHSWDSAFACNPRVIAGVFGNPLGDGKAYSYAMYYVGTTSPGGIANSIGVAFSNDGVSWKKYPQPVIRTTTQVAYGVGQPVAYNTDRKSAITLYYENIDPAVSHLAATSSDGVHFIPQGTLTTAGLDPDDPSPTWGDMAYDPKTGSWYAVFNRSLRPSSTTGGIFERGQLGVELYKIPADALLTGTTPWQELGTIDTNLTGYESNFIAGFIHDSFGNISSPTYPSIQLYVAESDPQPAWNASPARAGRSAEPPTWVLHLEQWSPDSALLPFYRYFNGSVHEVTTGWVSPSGGFKTQELLGHLYQNPQLGAGVAFYGCKQGDADYFVSLDSGCEGERILGKDGYAYSQPVAGLHLMAVYRCKTAQDHFVSKDPNCEGQTTEERLGYVVP